MKLKFNRFIVAAALSAITFSSTGYAADVTKADNTSLLDLGASWALGAAPTSTGVATWAGAYATAGSLSAAFTASTPVSWQGIKIGALSGTAAGLVSIGGTGTAVTGSQITIGSGGINMSTTGGANQNLVINSVTTVLGSSQTWDVGTGRNLRFGSTGTASFNSNIDGAAGVVVTVQGGGVVDLNSNGTAPSGMAGFAGKWIVNSGTTLRNISNFTTAFGTSTAADAITLSGGTLAIGGILGSQGNWSWNTKMTLTDATASSIDNQCYASGTNRWLKLESVIAGAALNSGSLTFKNTSSGTMNNDEYGLILSGANTFTGGMTINASTYVRIGGSAAGTTDANAGNNGSLASALAITDNGVLRLTRNDAWTLANNITGSGLLKIGGTIGTTTSQVVTVSGINSYSGATTVVNGRLKLTGTLTSPITVSGGSLSGTGSTTGLLTTAAGTSIVLAGGASTTSLSVNGATFNGATTVTFDTNPIPSTVYDVFTYGSGTVTTPGNLTVAARGALTNDTVNKKYVFTAAASTTRTWNTTTGTWDQNVTANWAEGDLKFVGGDSVVFNEPASDSIVTLTGVLNPTSVWVNNTTNAYTFSGSGSITGCTGLTKSGSGTLKLSSANTYTGGTTLTAGSIILSNGSALGSSGTITLNSPTTGASNTSLLVDASAASVTFARSLTIANEGTGTTTVGSSAFSATLQALFSGAITLNKDVSLVGASGGDRTQFSGGISGTGNIKVTGAGRVLFLSTANTYVGTTEVDGILQLSDGSTTANSLIPDTSDVTVNSGGFLRLAKGNNSETIGGLNGSGTVESISGSNTLIVGSGNASGSFSGVLQNNGATLALTKSGSGTQTLGGLNSYTGATIISGGTLQIGDNGVAGQLAAASAVTDNANLSFKRSDNAIVSNAISGSGTVTQDGSGTTTLTGALGYTGATTVNAGKLFVDTSGISSSSYTVNSAATLGGDHALSAVSVHNGGSLTLGNSSGVGTLTANTLTLGSGSGDTQTINTSVNSSSLNVLTTDGLVMNGTTTFACTGAVLSTPGSYTLATYAGTLGGSGSVAVALPPRIAGTLSLTTPGQINLVISGADTIKWTGATDAAWNTTSTNWVQILANTPSTYLNGNPGDTVTFDDTAYGTTAVTLDSTFTPAMVTVNNSSKAYSITGSGKITGTTTALVKNGSNTLTLGTSGGNDYAGGTTVNAGTLQLGAVDALPTTGALSLTGTLDLNANNQTVATLIGAGTVTNAGGSSATLTVANPTDITFDGEIQNGASATAFTKSGAGVLTLTADSSYTGDTTISAGTLELGSNGSTGGLSATTAITDNGVLRVHRSNVVTLGAAITGSGGITQYGVGSLNLNGANSYSGATTISFGSVVLGNPSALGSTASGTTVASGAILDLNGQSIGAEALAINGAGTGAGVLLNSSVTAASSSGNVVMGSASTINTTGNMSLSGVVSGSASLTKAGAGTLTLSGVNTYSGGTVITDGTLKLGNSKGISTSGTYGGVLNVKNGSFDVNGQSNFINANQPSGPSIWLTTATVTLGGMAGTAQIIDTAAIPLGIACAAGTAIVYDATGNPGMATVAARWAQIGTSNAGSRVIDIGDSSATAIEVDFTGGWGDTAAYDGRFATIQKIGAGTVRMSGTNNFPGLRITAGKFICNNAQALGVDRTGGGGAANLLTVDGGTLDMNGLSQSVGGLSDNSVATGVIRNDGGTDSTLTVGSSNASTTYSGTIVDGAKKIAIVKAGTGTLNLIGANTYTGDTTVNAGVLAVNGSSIANTGKLVINGGVVAATGTEVVGSLFFGEVQQAAGTWGAAGSGATHIDSHFSGTAGVVSVTTGPGGYSTWAVANAGGGAFNADFDNDGMPNGLEYFMGTTGSSFTANPQPVNGVVTWPRDSTVTGVSFKVLTSPDLVTWADHTDTADISNPAFIKYTLPSGQGVIFVRLEVTQD